jgi:PAS domain-containing protein
MMLITILRDTTARWKSDCRRAARRGASLALAESANLEAAGPRLLRVVSESFGWDLGVLWLSSGPGMTLNRLSVWQRPGLEESAFESLACGGAHAPPTPLLQQALVQGEPARVLAPAADDQAGRPRALALAFPLRLASTTIGVLAFYARAAEEPDEGQLATLATVGAQLAQFIRRMRAEEAVRSSEARLAAILEAALDAIITVDPGGRIVDFNPAAET